MSRQNKRNSIFAGLQEASRDSRQSVIGILKGYRRFRRGGRRMLLSEYLSYGLYHPDRTAKAAEFVGVQEAAILSLALNHRSHRRALVQDKLMFDATLRGLGYPVPGIQAILSISEFAGDFASLRDRDDLRRFLARDARYPLFCKPVRGQRSRGCFAISGFDNSNRTIRFQDGGLMPLWKFTKHLQRRHAHGVLFQDMLENHPEITAVCGPTVAGLRVITFLEKGQASVLGAFWKIPVNDATADNLWRGALIGQVNADTGRVGAVRNGTGLGSQKLDIHPATRNQLTRFQIPEWARVTELCCRGASLLSGMPLVGWDVAVTPSGPVIIEANSVPSLELTQCAGEEGFLKGNLLSRFEEEIKHLNRTSKRSRRGGRWQMFSLGRAKVLEGLGLNASSL